MAGKWTQLVVSDHAVDVYEPEGGPPYPYSILFLHGVGMETLTENEVYTSLFESYGIACASPHGGQAWWVDRICEDFDPEISAEGWLLGEVLPALVERWQITTKRFGLLGISMGGQGALRLAFKYPQTFPVVAAISSAVDYYELYGQETWLDHMYESKEQCRQDTAPLHIHPEHFPSKIFFCIDPQDMQWYRGNDRLHEKLRALSIPHEVDLTTQAGGHSWDYFNAMAERSIQLIQEGLLAESRRLL